MDQMEPKLCCRIHGYCKQRVSYRMRQNAARVSTFVEAIFEDLIPVFGMHLELNFTFYVMSYGKIDSRMSCYKIYHLSLRLSGIPPCPILAGMTIGLESAQLLHLSLQSRAFSPSGLPCVFCLGLQWTNCYDSSSRASH